MYEMKLADGTVVSFSGLNGTNFITAGQARVDTSVFTDENLASVVITDEDGNQQTYENLAFIQQQKQMNGDYYVCFRQKSDDELQREADEVEKTELQEALVEMYEMMLGGDE